MLLIIGLVFGAGIGFTVAAGNGITLDGHDHDHAAGGVMDHEAAEGQIQDHDHGAALSLAAGPDAPTLKVHVMADPVSGWNLHVLTRNFSFAPDRAGRDHVAGEGHAHVYVNGIKLARLYGPWMHIAKLPEGSVDLKVTLNSNDHRSLAVDGVPVEQIVSVTN